MFKRLLNINRGVLVKYTVALLFAVISGYLIASKGLSIAGALVAFPVIIVFFAMFFRYPKIGIYATLALCFILPILGRYVPTGVPYGLGIDFLLVLTFLVLIFKHWKNFDLSLAHNEVMVLMGLWMIYVILQIANPQAYSFLAWFYSMRGIALYQILIMGLAFAIFNSKKDWYGLLHVWFAFSILGILWAMKQKFIGISAAEQRWLDAGNDITHVLFGQLRIFSYYYDAGVFGAAMGQVCVMSFIFLLGPYSKARKVFYLLVGFFSFFALMLSGTRGALAVPGVGGIMYLIMTRNIKILTWGGGFLLACFIFLKYTTIGNANYDINRLRTALDPNDASLNTRLRNRARLTEYLRDKPFGGGLGTTGSWGQRFSPGTWLASFEPDGLYTRIRAETGLIGRMFYVWMWIYILVKGILFIPKYKTKEQVNIAMAILAGYAGLLVGNYSNPIMTQFPISLTTFLAITFVYSMRYWNEDGEVELSAKPTPKMAKKPKVLRGAPTQF